MKDLRWVIALLLLIWGVTCVSYWVLQMDQRTQDAAPPQAAAAVAAESQASAPAQEEIKTNEPLPSPGQSDTALDNALHGALGRYWLSELFESRNVARRIVATVDWLGRDSGPVTLRFVKPAPWGFQTKGSGSNLAISPENYARYRGYVHLCEEVDPKRLVSIYRRFHPQFQQAYRDLGHPDGNFDDRLVAVIDSLLAGPVVHGNIRLVSFNGVYKYADPAIESRSVGQKILVRIGSTNASRIKIKLAELRRELSGTTAPR